MTKNYKSISIYFTSITGFENKIRTTPKSQESFRLRMADEKISFTKSTTNSNIFIAAFVPNKFNH